MRRAALLAVVALGGCGGGDEPGTITVAAAASLTEALTACTDRAAVRLDLGGSDDLAAQIRQGVDVDVFAAANTSLPEALAAEGRVGEPRVFATNELVLAVPSGGDVDSLEDLAGSDLVVGSDSVPVGAYTREVLERLPDRLRADIEGAIRSEEPDVKGIVGKLVAGAADAGFVYRTDVTAAGDDLQAIALPARVRPQVGYGIAVVQRGEAAEAFVDDVLEGDCARSLRDAGFGPPP